MEGSRIGAWIARILQLISAAVVIGTSIALVRDINTVQAACKYYDHPKQCNALLGRWPSTSRFSTFVGAFGLLDAFLGIAALLLTREHGFVMLAIDTLAALFYFAGGINLAVLYAHEHAHSHRITADVTFHFIGLIATLAAVALVLLLRRSSGRSVSAI
ncbi:unnamed protein product [Zymoseptoria tritici ST99CH_1A5]|uniref:MARVEL domain-containing protein n=2 Tax=Zymoseptoria tritici TaxID=1047171 RepID=A0A2H1GPP3_ZYMTR|nr:unnamed protein product [Zymoseptoria tritici ST99CH_1E4]SMR57904.1 unnamed protein product [Zymoseptoria tritici ST99CH_3D1]SMY26338.1 unnamed protein product [Zymoseptoria tritici ST99CH_1A5]